MQRRRGPPPPIPPTPPPRPKTRAGFDFKKAARKTGHGALVAGKAGWWVTKNTLQVAGLTLLFTGKALKWSALTATPAVYRFFKKFKKQPDPRFPRAPHGYTPRKVARPPRADDDAPKHSRRSMLAGMLATVGAGAVGVGVLSGGFTSVGRSLSRRFSHDADWKMAMGSVEGTGKNPSSSASGPGQFTDGTYISSAFAYFRAYPESPEAVIFARDVNAFQGGEKKLSAFKTRRILEWKKEGGAFTQKLIDFKLEIDAAQMERGLGREPNSDEMYLSWQQGVGGALALLKNPGRKAVDVLYELKLATQERQHQHWPREKQVNTAYKLAFDSVKNNLGSFDFGPGFKHASKQKKDRIRTQFALEVTAGDFAQSKMDFFNLKLEHAMNAREQAAHRPLVIASAQDPSP